MRAARPGAARGPHTRRCRRRRAGDHVRPSGAGRYAEAVRQGAQIWSTHVPEIRLEQGTPAAVTFTTGKG
ncbi:MAG TPA: hypothetical protein VFY17_10155 [Pilimelia sp.]|nr:hypothetical protein [Pilimelia sp.]